MLKFTVAGNSAISTQAQEQCHVNQEYKSEVCTTQAINLVMGRPEMWRKNGSSTNIEIYNSII